MRGTPVIGPPRLLRLRAVSLIACCPIFIEQSNAVTKGRAMTKSSGEPKQAYSDSEALDAAFRIEHTTDNGQPALELFLQTFELVDRDPYTLKLAGYF